MGWTYSTLSSSTKNGRPDSTFSILKSVAELTWTYLTTVKAKLLAIFTCSGLPIDHSRPTLHSLQTLKLYVAYSVKATIGRTIMCNDVYGTFEKLLSKAFYEPDFCVGELLSVNASSQTFSHMHHNVIRVLHIRGTVNRRKHVKSNEWQKSSSHPASAQTSPPFEF